MASIDTPPSALVQRLSQPASCLVLRHIPRRPSDRHDTERLDARWSPLSRRGTTSLGTMAHRDRIRSPRAVAGRCCRTTTPRQDRRHSRAGQILSMRKRFSTVVHILIPTSYRPPLDQNCVQMSDESVPSKPRSHAMLGQPECFLPSSDGAS